MKSVELIGLSEYAKHVGCSANAVMKAIENGRIPRNAVAKVKDGGVGGTSYRIFINKVEADPAWVAGFNALSDTPTYPARLAVERIRAELENPVPDKTEEIPETPISPNTLTDTQPREPGFDTLAEAQRREKIAKAAIAQIELMQKKDALVSKDAVYKQLFEAGRQLRDSLMAIPNRITAEIISAGDNHAKVQQIITDAIASSLESLTDLQNSKIG